MNYKSREAKLMTITDHSRQKRYTNDLLTVVSESVTTTDTVTPK